MSLQAFQTPRAVQHHDDTGRWIVHQAPDIDPAWALEKALEKHNIPPASERLNARKTGFQTFIHSFLSSQGDQEAYHAFRSAASWEDVRQEAEQAVDKYVNQGNTWNNPFRRTKRLVGSTASRLEFLTQLIPNGDYLGVLCGGLKLAYNAANRHKQLREIIIGALESLDTEINFTKVLIREYAWDENVRKTTEDLYVAILDAVEAIMKWIDKRKGFRGILQAGKAIAKQNEYGSELEIQVSTNIKEKVEAFERAVRTCLSIETRAIATNVVTVGKTLDIVDGKIDNAVGELGRAVASVYTIEDQLRDMREAMLQYMEKDRKDRELFAISQDNLLQMLQAQQTQLLMARSNSPQPPSPHSHSHSYHPPPTTLPIVLTPQITPHQLLQSLNLVPPTPNTTSPTDLPSLITLRTSHERDLIFYFGSRLPPPSHRAISSLLQDARFTTWFSPQLASPSPPVLLINGSDLDSASSSGEGGLVSPWSYLLAMLARTVHDIPGVYTAGFWCRLHCDPTTPSRHASSGDWVVGPAGLMRSIIGQLVLQHPLPWVISSYLPVGMGGGGAGDVMRGVQAGDIPSLCGLFDAVLKSLVAASVTAVVMVMIDGASFFENEYHLREMDMVMRYLDSLVRAVAYANTVPGGGGGLVFKLLVTSPTRVEHGRRWFPDAVVVDVPSGGELMAGGIEGLEGGSGVVLMGLAGRATTPVGPESSPFSSPGGSFRQSWSQSQ